MSQRRPDPTKWVWCILVLSSGTAWSPVSSVTVRSPEKIPTTIETQAKFFQDFFSVQLSPYKIEFGHVCEDPNTWEQRYEKKDFKNHRDMGKVKDVSFSPPFCFCLITRDANGQQLSIPISKQINRYRHLPTSEDFDQGYRLGNDRHFIERHEKSRPAAGLFLAKIRWGDNKGGYGEHYWDLNHAGHTKNQEEDEYDDGDYNEELQDYPETGEKANFEREEYYPDASEYERSARPKRENSKVEVEALKGERTYEEKQRSKQKISKYTEPNRTKRNLDNQDDFQVDLMTRSLKDNRQRHLRKYNERTLQPRDKNHIVLGVDHKSKAIKGTVKAEQINFVPYEVSPGLRRLNRQVAPESISRLFLEPSSGHVIDKAMEQAFVLQPVHLNRMYN